MKLLRVGPPGREKSAILDAAGTLRDISAHLPDLSGTAVSPAVLDRLRGLDVTSLPEVTEPGRIGPCLSRVPNFFCIGLNYARHAAETGSRPPSEPILFSKATSALSGPNDPVIIPRNAHKTDWEVELGVVIGRDTHYVSEAQALDHVAGYCVINDISEREFQMERKGQWIKAEIISYMSQFMALQPGDIIATGTPAGVGMGRAPQRFLRAGDVMELSVEGLGEQRQEVIAAQ